jgi:hypothetical protein
MQKDCFYVCSTKDIYRINISLSPENHNSNQIKRTNMRSGFRDIHSQNECRKQLLKEDKCIAENTSAN